MKKFNEREHAEQLAEAFCSTLGVAYTPEELLDVHFSFVELSKLGYSLSILMITPDEYISRRQEFGYPLEERVLGELQESGGIYSYQLRGRQYTTRGSHASPLTPRPWMAAAVALFNVIKINQEEAAPVN